MKATTMMTFGLLLTASAVAFAQEKPADEGVALTVYNGGYGVVRETRSLDIAQDGTAKYTDVARYIDATTVHFKSLTDPAAKLLEQNYQYDLVDSNKLLQKYIDKPLEVVTKDNKTYAGTLLSFDGGQIVLQEERGLAMIQRPDNVRDIRFRSLPEGLLTRPTLVWKVATQKPGKQLTEVTYQTSGLGWHAEYVLVLGADDKTADLSGWVSVQNNSGKLYNQAKIKFIAGDVRRVQGPQVEMPADKPSGRASGSVAAPMEEKAFFEYHMYTLPRPSTVADNEVKQLEMFPPVAQLKVDKKYLYQPMQGWRWYGSRNIERSYGVTSDKKVQVFIEFKNTEANKLGIPLPAGKVRVYKQDPADKALEFVGEEKIDHTPKDEQLSLQVGNAFDVVGERIQTDFKVENNRNWMSESFKITLRNHKDEPITVRVKEVLYRWSTWQIMQKSHDFTKLDSQTIAFDVPVAASEKDKPGETVVTYRVEYTW